MYLKEQNIQDMYRQTQTATHFCVLVCKDFTFCLFQFIQKFLKDETFSSLYKSRNSMPSIHICSPNRKNKTPRNKVLITKVVNAFVLTISFYRLLIRSSLGMGNVLLFHRKDSQSPEKPL